MLFFIYKTNEFIINNFQCIILFTLWNVVSVGQQAVTYNAIPPPHPQYVQNSYFQGPCRKRQQTQNTVFFIKTFLHSTVVFAIHVLL